MKKFGRRALERTVRLVHPLAARLTRPLTMGVRAMILDEEDRICLVRHSYAPGWHMPGGAVEPGETLHQALVREVHEETGLAVTGRPELFGVYLNEAMARRDHVALYVVRHFETTARRPNPREIVDHGFHPLAALPPDVTNPTKRRLAEVLEGRTPDPLGEICATIRGPESTRPRTEPGPQDSTISRLPRSLSSLSEGLPSKLGLNARRPGTQIYSRGLACIQSGSCWFMPV